MCFARGVYVESVLKDFSFSLHPFIHASIPAPLCTDRAGLVLAPTHVPVEGGTLVPTLAAGAEAGGEYACVCV